MLNYLKAELFKVFRQRWFCFNLALLLLCSGAMSIAFCFINRWTFSKSIEQICILLPAGFLLLFILGSSVFADLYKYQTLKNEVSFGISCVRIYLGKLFAAILVCVVVCVAVVGVYLGVSWIMKYEGWSEDLTAKLTILGYCLMAALPLWLGALGLFCMLEFNIKNSTVAACIYGGYFLIFETQVQLFMDFADSTLSEVVEHLSHLLLTHPITQFGGQLTSDLMATAWTLGLGWFIITTAIGIVVFQKKDIK